MKRSSSPPAYGRSAMTELELGIGGDEVAVLLDRQEVQVVPRAEDERDENAGQHQELEEEQDQDSGQARRPGRDGSLGVEAHAHGHAQEGEREQGEAGGRDENTD